MTTEYSIFRSLKGAPLSILMFMHFTSDDSNIIYTQANLSSYTGYSHPVIKDAISLLLSYKLIVANPGRYKVYRLSQQFYDLFAKMPINDSLASSQPIEPSHTSETVLVSKNNLISILKDYGVGPPTDSKIASLPHVNRDYLTAHFSSGLANGDQVGLIIHRIISGDPEPKKPVHHAQDPESYRKSWLRSEITID